MESIIRKIKACLALAGSDNPNESATAMRQAKKLMAQHGIGESLLDVSRTDIKIKYARPPVWFSQIGLVVAQAFGCSFFTGYKEAIFVGPDGSTEIAAYCFEVVLRGLEASKSAFIKRTCYYHSATDKKQRASSYCIGFVLGAQHAVDKFSAVLDLNTKQTYRDYLSESTGKGITNKKNNKKIVINSSVLDGIQDGKNVSIHAPVGQQAPQLQFFA